MIVAAISFTMMLFFVRYLEGRYPSIQVVFFRALAGLIFIIEVIIPRSGTRHLIPFEPCSQLFTFMH